MKEPTMLHRIAMHMEEVFRHEAAISPTAYAEAARSVLQHMREPSKAMSKAGADPEENIGELGATVVYTHMIDAALAEKA